MNSKQILPPVVTEPLARELSDSFSPAPREELQPWWQFSIGEMLFITTYVAAIVALTKAIGIWALIIAFHPFTLLAFAALYWQHRKRRKANAAKKVT